MNLKDQLTADMENVFMNPEELTDSVTIDGEPISGFLLEKSGSEGELVYILDISSNVVINEYSVIETNKGTFGVVSGPYDDGFGKRTVILGDPV